MGCQTSVLIDLHIQCTYFDCCLVVWLRQLHCTVNLYCLGTKLLLQPHGEEGTHVATHQLPPKLQNLKTFRSNRNGIKLQDHGLGTKLVLFNTCCMLLFECSVTLWNRHYYLWPNMAWEYIKIQTDLNTKLTLQRSLTQTLHNIVMMSPIKAHGIQIMSQENNFSMIMITEQKVLTYIGNTTKPIALGSCVHGSWSLSSFSKSVLFSRRQSTSFSIRRFK